jgi:hypothetical protein
VVGSYPLSSQAPTPVEVELGCDNIVRNIVSIKRVRVVVTGHKRNISI